MNRKEILLAGAGGQGILFLGNLLSLGMVQKGKWVITTPSYGASVRGGEVKCGIVVSDVEIEDPLVNDADIAVILNDASLGKYGPQVKEGGTLLYNMTEKAGKIVDTFAGRYRLIPIPLCTLGPDKFHNMVAIGVLMEVDTDLGGICIEEILAADMKKRGRETLVKQNLDNIAVGRTWYRSEGGKENVSR